ncbi:MAG: GyrI-like domain-containing protein [Ilumatobacteraceae bacterium]
MPTKKAAVVERKPSDDDLYRPPSDPVLVDVPPFDFFMIDGEGDPNSSPDFQAAISALYSLAYPVVISMKRAGRSELKVGALEGLWWADDVGVFDPERQDRAAWRWTMMLRQPPAVPDALMEDALARMTKKVGVAVARRVRLEQFDEGRCAQLMHHGPYADEGPSIVRLHEFVAAQGLRLRGRHHEIYLSDPRRSAPAKMKTVIRHPVSG